jgi:hypothetical protein
MVTGSTLQEDIAITAGLRYDRFDGRTEGQPECL